jgi:hypothetical protein
MKRWLLERLGAILPVLTFLLIVINQSDPAFACECTKRDNLETEFRLAHSVFVGEAIEIKDTQPDASITFRVEKIWKGNKAEKIIVLTNNQGKACGYHFKKGERYLVYAFADGDLRTSICNRTNDLRSADGDLEELNQRKPL